MANLSRLPLPVWQRWEWQLRGACRDADPETFFSPEAERGARRRAREAAAKSYCQRCPVLQECRAHALVVREPYGVWGGLNIEEREKLLTGARRLPIEPPEPVDPYEGAEVVALADRAAAPTPRTPDRSRHELAG